MLGDLVDRIRLREEAILKTLGFEFSLTINESQILHALDKVKLLLWSMDQMAMGNEYAQEIYDNTQKVINENDLPEEVGRFLIAYGNLPFPRRLSCDFTVHQCRL